MKKKKINIKVLKIALKKLENEIWKIKLKTTKKKGYNKTKKIKFKTY